MIESVEESSADLYRTLNWHFSMPEKKRIVMEIEKEHLKKERDGNSSQRQRRSSDPEDPSRGSENSRSSSPVTLSLSSLLSVQLERQVNEYKAKLDELRRAKATTVVKLEKEYVNTAAPG